jgi:hypothetical protein
MNMKDFNLGKLLVVGKFGRQAPRLMQTHQRSCLSCNFAEMIAYTSFSDVFLYLQICLGRNLGFHVREFDLEPISAKYGHQS